MNAKIYVDGQSGTTGLEIHQRLARYEGIELLTLAEADRKNPQFKKDILNAADVVFLCLPDDAARDSVALIENSTTRVIDASTAHRCLPDWVYGLPELAPEQRTLIQHATRVAVTGCHAAAAILSLNPLVRAGLVPKDAGLAIQSITGYSGGGKQMIADYQSGLVARKSPRPYGLHLHHKHLPEIQRYAGLETPPVFLPIVADYYQGLAVSIPLHRKWLGGQTDVTVLHRALVDYYRDEMFVSVLPLSEHSGTEAGFFDIEACNLTNRVDIALYGDGDQMLLMARLDNLGKGASGAALQCMNLMLGLQENTHLAV